MRPLHVERDLLSPTDLIAVSLVEGRRAGHRHDGERGGVGKAERCVERPEVFQGGGTAERVEDHDGAARTVKACLDQPRQAVGGADGARSVAGDAPAIGRAVEEACLAAKDRGRVGGRIGLGDEDRMWVMVPPERRAGGEKQNSRDESGESR